MVVARLALAITALLALSGCVVSEDDLDAAANEAANQLEDADFGSASANQAAGDAASVLRALSNVSTNVTGLNVTVSFSADGDGTLTYDVAFGDNSSENGTMDVRAVEVDENVTPTGNYSYVVTLSHAYDGPGTYNITVAVAAGNFSLERTLNVTVAEPAPPVVPMEPMDMSGTCTTGVNDGMHTFDVTYGQARILASIDIGGGGVDLDWYLIDPSGTEQAAADSFSAASEGDLEVEGPAAGTWTIEVACFLGVAASYDIHIEFT